MKTELEYIQETISTYSAFEYAEMRLKKEKESYSLTVFNTKTGQTKQHKPTYEQYMQACWSNSATAILNHCIEQSRISKLNEYAEMVQMYTGWIENGRVFVLNKKEGFVSFLYKTEKTDFTINAKIKNVTIRTNYNPKNVDCIEEDIDGKYFTQNICDQNYELSKDEKYLNIKCDLINKQKYETA